MSWILIAETAVFGLLLLAALPMWAMVPVLFGVTERTPKAEASRVYALLLLFVVAAIGGLGLAWASEGGTRMAGMAAPVVTLLLLLAARPR